MAYRRYRSYGRRRSSSRAKGTFHEKALTGGTTISDAADQVTQKIAGPLPNTITESVEGRAKLLESSYATLASRGLLDALKGPAGFNARQQWNVLAAMPDRSKGMGAVKALGETLTALYVVFFGQGFTAQQAADAVQLVIGAHLQHVASTTEYTDAVSIFQGLQSWVQGRVQAAVALPTAITAFGAPATISPPQMAIPNNVLGFGAPNPQGAPPQAPGSGADQPQSLAERAKSALKEAEGVGQQFGRTLGSPVRGAMQGQPNVSVGPLGVRVENKPDPVQR